MRLDPMPSRPIAICLLSLAFTLLVSPPKASAIDRSELAVVINTADPLSVQIGHYYAEQRHIPFQNVIEVSFSPGRSVMTLAEFQSLKVAVDLQTPDSVQGYALTWAAPYRVECMSITSAFALGFDLAYCATGCQATKRSPYFNSPARRPYAQHKLRPTMTIAARSFEEARALIDRGVASDGLNPAGTAYLLSTSDKARNVRSAVYTPVESMMRKRLRVRVLRQDALLGEHDVLFYFTGTTHVEGLETLSFLPGAIADHLTSTGGRLTDSPQMSALRWLEAGATASYGTVIEPCNLPLKFPHPAIVIARYVQGETLLEAYWKSVAMPGQGIFIGEPLARPFRTAPGR